MEGAIKLLKFCFEQKEAGFDIWFNYSPHVNWIDITIYNEGKWFMGAENIEVYRRYFKIVDLTPERADEIINEIKEKLK